MPAATDNYALVIIIDINCGLTLFSHQIRLEPLSQQVSCGISCHKEV
ncbi:hypothetical protein THF1C08_30314 [Vibrio jasicida]|uniref:Uncharacterized protein n=1 Tax=Vibrio jasicida TaxID=766224 RepID=A0AAU9QR04_9VIBR|nr:hypothetical protein THF1C08_30314 [Vibrio jasicida]CAH1599377.1 hypothetical protein THF1A12_40121 [Vibrio jasicida]